MASNMRGESAWPYAAIYEIETDDIEAARREMEARAMDERIARCAAFDYDSVYASIYEPIGEVVNAG